MFNIIHYRINYWWEVVDKGEITVEEFNDKFKEYLIELSLKMEEEAMDVIGNDEEE